MNPLPTDAAGPGALRAPRFLTASLARELGILLCLSVMFPFLIHVLPVPETARLGAMLLPMFYAPLLAGLWGRKRSALAVALLAPWLNWALTSHPSPLGAIVMMVQLLVFVLTLRSLMLFIGARPFLAAPAYFLAMAASLAVTAAFPELGNGQSAFDSTVRSMAIGLPGIAILVLLNWLALQYYPPGSADGGPRMA